MARDTCLARQSLSGKEDQILDAREQCLRRRAVSLQALVGQFEGEPDGTVVDNAVEAALALDRIDECADVRKLAYERELPTDPKQRERAAKLERQLKEIWTLRNLGKYKEALALAGKERETAKTVGFPRIHAETLHLIGHLQRLIGETEKAEGTLQEALVVAAEAGDDRRLAELWLERAETAFLQKGNEQALLLVQSARIAVTRVGKDPELDAQIDVFESNVLTAVAKYDEAYERAQAAIAAITEHAPQNPRFAAALLAAAWARFNAGRFEEARTFYERARAVHAKLYGPTHPELATYIFHLGNLEWRLGHPDEARKLYQQALEVRERAYGPNHRAVASTLKQLGSVERIRGNHDLSLRYRKRALAIYQSHGGAAALDIGFTLLAIGNLSYDKGHYDEAIRTFEESLDAFGTDVAQDHPARAFPLSGLGASFVRLGKPQQAIAPLEKAIFIRHGKIRDPIMLGDTQFALARALWDSGRDRDRAIELARDARRELEKVDGKRNSYFKLPEVKTWLVQHARN